MRIVYVVIFCFAAVLISCQNSNTEKKDTKENPAVDSAQSYINNMVDEMAPPDSNYSGDFFLKYDNGLMKVKGFFRFGKRHGQWQYYYGNGFLWSEGLFENGKMNGPTKVYHENGKVYYEGAYKVDKAVGTWNFFDSTGTMVHERVYDDKGNVLSDKDFPPTTDKK